MMKKVKVLIISLIILMASTILANASVRTSSIPPMADIYKEGIYHFSKGSGNKMILKLETLDKPMTIIIIENENKNLKYYVEFTKDSPKIEILLDKPLSAHTTVMIGEGELSFTFE